MLVSAYILWARGGQNFLCPSANIAKEMPSGCQNFALPPAPPPPPPPHRRRRLSRAFSSPSPTPPVLGCDSDAAVHALPDRSRHPGPNNDAAARLLAVPTPSVLLRLRRRHRELLRPNPDAAARFLAVRPTGDLDADPDAAAYAARAPPSSSRPAPPVCSPYCELVLV